MILTEDTRAREWDSVVTCHASLGSARTWHLHNRCIGKHKLVSRHYESEAAMPQVSVCLCVLRVCVCVCMCVCVCEMSYTCSHTMMASYATY